MALYRVKARLDPDYLRQAQSSPAATPQKAVEDAAARALGYDGAPPNSSEVLLAIEDPTDEGAITVVATRKPKDVSSVASVLAVEDAGELPDIRPANCPNLDDGLMADEARAVALALLKETDTDRLEGMGDAFAPDLPCVGALLLTKARLEHARKRGGQDHHDALAEHRDGVSRAMNTKPMHARKGVGTRGGGAGLVQPPGDVEGILGELRKATLDLGPAAASSWEAYAGAISLALEGDPVNTWQTSSLYGQKIAQDLEGASKALGACLVEPALAASDIYRIADLCAIDIQTADAVKSCLRPIGGSVVLCDPARSRVLLSGRAPSSNAAVKLAASTIRPLSQQLADPDAIPRLFGALRYDGEPAEQVDRAKRAVSRRSWVEWYRAAETAGMLGKVR